jgi:hypothetical protein
MKKIRLFYDIATVILVVLAVIALITVFSGPVQTSFEEAESMLLTTMLWFTIFYAYSGLYSISLIVLVAMKEEKVLTSIVMTLGCLVLPGILPLFYYLSSLRKKL